MQCQVSTSARQGDDSFDALLSGCGDVRILDQRCGCPGQLSLMPVMMMIQRYILSSL